LVRGLRSGLLLLLLQALRARASLCARAGRARLLRGAFGGGSGGGAGKRRAGWRVRCGE
jgi:hypothetical protein